MNKKMNKKGFTLIELLAVIIVLAIIMVLAIPSVLNATNDAKKKEFVMYGQRVSQKAAEYIAYKEMMGQPIAKGTVLDASTIGLTDTGSYKACVLYNSDGNLQIYLTDTASYYFAGATTSQLNDGGVGSGKKTLTVGSTACTLS